LATYPPDPLPLIREGGSLGIPPPILGKERGIKGVRLRNNLFLKRLTELMNYY